MNDSIESVEQIVVSYPNHISPEQLYICESIKHGNNVIVDACAGSGKSTTVFSTCKILEDKEFLILTFNRALRYESKEKINHLKIMNAEVHTYHSLAVCYYDSQAHTDNQLVKLINRDVKPIKSPPRQKFDIIVIDEAQDMSELYFKIIQKFTKDLGYPFQLLVLGDYRQGLYEFKGSDIRYLTHSEFIWKCNPLLINPNKFIYANLRTTYRLTNQMASFVNYMLLGENRLIACRDGVPIKYHVSPFFEIKEKIFGLINAIVKTKKGKYDDIFILSPSIKHSILIRTIENELVSRNIPCHIPLIEDSEIDERVIKNKVVFCTFHSSKGRQRKYVFVLNFDNTYFDYNARDKPRNICPNTIYVATTRATDEMYIFEQIRYDKNSPIKQSIYSFEFLKATHEEMNAPPINQYIEFIQDKKGIPQYQKDEKAQPEDISLYHTYYTSPTELTKFLSYKTIDEIFTTVNDIWSLEQTDQPEIIIPNVVETNIGYEDVCDLNGIIIPMIYYDTLFNSNASVMRNQIKAQLSATPILNNSYLLKTKIYNIPKECKTPADYLYIANIQSSIKEKLFFRLNQITNYNWITPQMIEQTNERLKSIIPSAPNTAPPNTILTIEQVITTPDDDHYYIDELLKSYFGVSYRFRFTAIVDIITMDTVWELKCTNDITFEHKIQVIVYAWLWRLTYEKTSTEKNTEALKEFRILNVKSGDIWHLNATIEQLTSIMVVLLQKLIRYENETINDNNQEFIDRHFTT